MTDTTATTADPVHQPQTMTTFQVKKFIDASQLKADLRFSSHDLTSAMMEQASMFAHYGELASDAAKQVDVVKLLLESTEATVYKKLRDEAAVKNEKVTEAQLEKMVMRHPRVIEMRIALNEAKRVEATGKHAVEAFRHRRDMLVQQGLISREERKGELRIPKEDRDEQIRSDAAAAARGDMMNRLRAHQKSSESE